jgi:regulatory protein
MENGDIYTKTLSHFQNLCSKRECCTKDIYIKAVKLLEGDKAAAEKIVASLIEERYVDDLRYASAFARDKSSLSGWGIVKISYMLSAKGIPKSVIAEAVKEIEVDKAANKLESIIAAKYKTLKGEKDCKLKLLRFALGRGYNYDEVAPIVDNLMKEE